MTTEQTAHLSEEVIHDVMIGLGSAEADQHIAVCEVCRGQVEGFDSELQTFNQASLAWCKAKPVTSLDGTGKWNVRQAMSAPLGWALAAGVLIMIGLPAWMEDHHPPMNPNAVATSAPGDSEVQIAQDNDLLRSVDVALSGDDESPLRGLPLSPEPYSHLRSNTNR
jgi:hypothetical protein